MLPVTVIIPTYNREKFLIRSVSSVLRQSMSCSEIIIIDDGSIDNSINVLKRIFSDTSIPCSIVHQTNRGPAAARNRGVEKAHFPYIAFLDSDDHWKKNKLKVQFEALQKSPNSMISHTREIWMRRGEHLNQKKIHIPRNGNIFDHCLKLCAVGMSTVMVKKEIFHEIGYFDESLQCCEDYDYWLRVSSKYEFLLVDKPLTVKEGGRDDQVSFIHRQGMDRLRLYALKKILATGQLDPQQYTIAVEEFVKKSNIYGKGCLKHGKQALGHQILDDMERLLENAITKYPQLKNIRHE